MGSEEPTPQHRSVISTLVVQPIASVTGLLGSTFFNVLEQVGYSFFLLMDASKWVVRSIVQGRVRMGRRAIVTQLVRVGVRSVVIVCLVSSCVGLILAFQLAPPLDEFGSRDAVANIIGVAVLRELGPLIGAIVLTGFAGASMAAEIGTMAVSEEIDALEAHALNPVRFLVVPRVIASMIAMAALAVLADITAIAASLGVSVLVLDIPKATYIQNTLDQVKAVDFLTGVAKAAVFGVLIGLIACSNGLRLVGTSAGAEGVGKATTATVVQSVVAIVIADLIFTAIFFAIRLT